MPMSAERISEKIVAALPAPAKGNKLHYFSGASLQGKKAPSGFAVRVTSVDKVVRLVPSCRRQAAPRNAGPMGREL